MKRPSLKPKYVVVYERAEKGWSAYVPDLPGCVAAADTRKELAGLIREAMTVYVAELRDMNEPVPTPRAVTERVEA